ncbi:MAG: metallophosphoesterase [Clostridia bacterium]|nr:metallophosphoesterase [Clostridia bacterium]
MSDKSQAQILKFLHCGDIHLDTPFAGLPPEKSEERRRGLRASFMKMMEYIRGTGINYVLISGDLFEAELATNSTAELLVREFRNCPETEFIIAPGRADHVHGNAIYESKRLPENCHVFTSETMERFDFDDHNVRIYGWGFTEPTLNANPLIDQQVDDISKINIVIGYADIDGALDSDTCPIATADLKRFGADYYAFGSRHEGGDFVSLEDSMYGYSGALESIGFDDPGIGGAKLVVVKYNGGELSIDAKNMSFGHIVFKSEKVDITGVGTSNEIINRVSRLVSDKKYGSETALRVELVGDIDPRFVVPKNLGSDAFGLYSFELLDKTMPLFGTDYLKRDMSVKGEIFRQLLPLLKSEKEEERLVAAIAFREGLAALENRDIDA